MTVKGYYEDAFHEGKRLTDSSIEWVRSKELIGRVLPSRPGRVADVAGGTGPYAVWLAELGHQVDLLDLAPSHVAQARDRAAAAGVIVTCVEGDARTLPWPDASFDVVLVMGAMYHLQERADRLACLREAHRVLKPGGALAVSDHRFAGIIDEDLASGRHENPFDHPLWFTTAYLHNPIEIPEELTSTGFEEIQVLPVEGFTSASGVPDALNTDEGMATVLNHVRLTETEPALLGASSHVISLARKAG